MHESWFKPYDYREWQIAALLLISYIATDYATALAVPPEVHLAPALAIMITALYFGGMRLLPVAYLAALIAAFIGSTHSAILVFVFAALPVIHAAITALFISRAGIDPLFRRRSDVFSFLGITAVTSIIVPLLSALLSTASGAMPTALTLWQHYIATLFVTVIIVPFLMRWFAKRHFKRTPYEIAETAAVFALLIGINGIIFDRGIQSIAGIPSMFLLLPPLFWIALRLRPRFTTLALLLTATMGIIHAFVIFSTTELPEELFNLEIVLTILAACFSIITSLEEDRRVNTNLLRSQMATLKNAVTRISSESQAKNDFIAILAHELRNPLAPIASSIDLLKLRGARDAEEGEIISVMEDRMNTIRRLLDDLLDISRISEGKIAIDRTPVDLAPVIYRAMLSTEHHRNERHQRLVFASVEAPIIVLGDALRLEQVFSNLLTNASKYSGSGSTIELRVRTQDGAAEIAIRDQGIGIRPEERESIFLPFFQSESGDRSKKGLGIGLSLVRNFVHLHDGTIEASSEGPGKGSTFTVRLPLVSIAPRSATKAPAVSELPQAPEPEPTSTSRSTSHILVVDDNDAAAAAIGRLIELEGCSVSFAYDGKQAVEAAAQDSPDAILLDIGLPDQDGYSVARTLRSEGFTGLLVALSGYNMDKEGTTWREAGFDRYLVKPASLTDLRTVLTELRKTPATTKDGTLSLAFPDKE